MINFKIKDDKDGVVEMMIHGSDIAGAYLDKFGNVSIVIRKTGFEVKLQHTYDEVKKLLKNI